MKPDIDDWLAERGLKRDDLPTLTLDASDGDDIASGDARPLGLVEGGSPPTEYLMFAPGINETVKGPLLFDEEAAAACMAFYESRGRKRIAGDWEHDSQTPPELRPSPFKGFAASHWFTPAVRPGPELWATDVKWTPTAFEQITHGEYAHTSPVVKYQKATGRIMAVLSSALTNDPATIGQPQLVAASATAPDIKADATTTTEKITMATWTLSDDVKAPIVKILDGEHSSETDMCTKLAAHLAATFPDEFGEEADDEADADVMEASKAKLADAEKEKESLKAKLADSEKDKLPDAEKKELRALRAAVVELTGRQNAVEQIAALTAFKLSAEEVVALSANAARLGASALDRMIEDGKKAKKLTPADVAAGSKTKTGAYLATLRQMEPEMGIRALSAFLDNRPALVVTADTATKEHETADLATVQLNAIEVESCKKNGTDPAAMLKIKRERVAEQLANGVQPRI